MDESGCSSSSGSFSEEEIDSSVVTGQKKHCIIFTQAQRACLLMIGSKQRCFNCDWYKSYSWLEYSIESDTSFCYPCRIFNVEEGRSHNTFTKVLFLRLETCNWKRRDPCHS